MALSDKNQQFSEQGGNTPPTIQTNNVSSRPTSPVTTSISFADALRSSTTNSHSTPTTKVITTRIWRTATWKNALLLNVTALPASLTHQWFMKAIHKQTDAVHAVMLKKANHQRYLELYTKKRSNHNLLEDGLSFSVGKDTYKIMPSQALEDDSTIVRIFLSHLPPEEDEDLIPGLQDSLRWYGQVHHLELNKDPDTQYFIGTGYAIINLKPGPDQTVLRALTHKIEYMTSGASFHAVWANMPTWCRYCHEEGHTKFDCAKSLAATTCYQCHLQGHRAAQCQKKTPKKARKTPLGQTPVDPTPPPAKRVILTPRSKATTNSFAALDWAEDTEDLPTATATTTSAAHQEETEDTAVASSSSSSNFVYTGSGIEGTASHYNTRSRSKWATDDQTTTGDSTTQGGLDTQQTVVNTSIATGTTSGDLTKDGDDQLMDNDDTQLHQQQSDSTPQTSYNDPAVQHQQHYL
jgi:hypothetical protein